MVLLGPGFTLTVVFMVGFLFVVGLLSVFVFFLSLYAVCIRSLMCSGCSCDSLPQNIFVAVCDDSSGFRSA